MILGIMEFWESGIQRSPAFEAMSQWRHVQHLEVATEKLGSTTDGLLKVGDRV